MKRGNDEHNNAFWDFSCDVVVSRQPDIVRDVLWSKWSKAHRLTVLANIAV